MPKPRFKTLRADLLRKGVSPHYVRRTVSELQDHYLDLESEALAAGRSAEHAAAEAKARLGEESTIAAAVAAQSELQSWPLRRPWAICVRSLILLALIPVLPIRACMGRGELIARWSLSISFSALVTGGLLLGMWALVMRF